MRKRLLLFCVVIVCMTGAASPVMAQGYPVLDIANLMQAINTLYASHLRPDHRDD